MKKLLNMYVGPVKVSTIVAAVLVLAAAAGIFLPWYEGTSLFGVLLAGFGMSGTMNALAQKFDFSAMSTWFNVIFILIAVMMAGSLLFGVRMIASSVAGRVKGLVPAGVLMSVLALAGFAVVAMLGGIGGVQIGLWLCLVSGVAEAVWGIFE